MTTQDKTPIRALIEAVEAGTADDFALFYCIGYEGLQKALGIYTTRASAGWQAYYGSLDAAKALHEALLPGWEWHLGPSNAKVYPYNGSPLKSWSGMSDSPARAWLLAILKAYRSQAQP